MKIIIIGDLHFGARSTSQTTLQMMNNFFRNELFPYILDNNVKKVICLGDLFDKRKNIDFTIAEYIRKNFLGFFRQNKVEFYSIIGNHDTYFKESLDINGPSQLIEKNDPYIHIIENPTKITFNTTNFYLIPWVCADNKQSIIDFLDVNKDKNGYVCGHFELTNFIMYSSVYSTSGTIDVDTLRNYKYVFSGHFHTPSEKGNVMYVGTPYELTWNDYGDKKRFIVYDTKTDEIEEIFTKTKMFHKIIYDENNTNIDFSQYQNCYVKVISNTVGKSSEKLNMFMSKINEISNPITLQLIDNTTISIEEATDISSEDVNNPIEIMQNMLKQIIDDPETLDEAITYSQQIYTQALEQL